MASYSRGETVVRRRFWTVRTDMSWRGAAIGDFLDAFHAAAASYRQAHGLPSDHALSDDALWVAVADDEVIISYTIEEEAGHG